MVPVRFPISVCLDGENMLKRTRNSNSPIKHKDLYFGNLAVVFSKMVDLIINILLGWRQKWSSSVITVPRWIFGK